MASKSNRRGARVSPVAGTIDVIESGGCVTAVLNQPAAGNRIGAAMADRLIELAERVEDDDSVRVLALTGAGNAFCTGFELDVDHRLVESLAVITKPTLAIINGDAFDEGLELALALDIRLAAAHAHFALTQLTRGVMPHFGGTQRLARLLGSPQTLKMILTGAAIDGREALRRGLITYIADGRARLQHCAADVIASIISRAPLAIKLAKEAVLKGFDMTLDQGIRLEEDLYALLQTTADRGEGVRAFREKRRPLFKGA
jgi:enoyl-CoA hydratase/carnithine racemase